MLAYFHSFFFYIDLHSLLFNSFSLVDVVIVQSRTLWIIVSLHATIPSHLAKYQSWKSMQKPKIMGPYLSNRYLLAAPTPIPARPISQLWGHSASCSWGPGLQTLNSQSISVDIDMEKRAWNMTRLKRHQIVRDSSELPLREKYRSPFQQKSRIFLDTWRQFIQTKNVRQNIIFFINHHIFFRKVLHVGSPVVSSQVVQILVSLCCLAGHGRGRWESCFVLLF